MEKETVVLITNGYVPTPDGTFKKCNILVIDGKIKRVFDGSPEVINPGSTRIDATGRIVLPGRVSTGLYIPSLEVNLKSVTKDAIRSGITTIMGIYHEHTVGEITLQNLYERALNSSYTNYSFYDVYMEPTSSGQLIRECEPSDNCGLFVGEAILKNKTQKEWVIGNVQAYPVMTSSNQSSLLGIKNKGLLPYFEIQTLLQEGYNDELSFFSQVIERIDAEKLKQDLSCFRIKKGLIHPGYDADIIILGWDKIPQAIMLDDLSECTSVPTIKSTHFKVDTVVIGGQVVYQKGMFSTPPKNRRIRFE